MSTTPDVKAVVAPAQTKKRVAIKLTPEEAKGFSKIVYAVPAMAASKLIDVSDDELLKLMKQLNSIADAVGIDSGLSKDLQEDLRAADDKLFLQCFILTFDNDLRASSNERAAFIVETMHSKLSNVIIHMVLSYAANIFSLKVLARRSLVEDIIFNRGEKGLLSWQMLPEMFECKRELAHWFRPSDVFLCLTVLVPRGTTEKRYFPATKLLRKCHIATMADGVDALKRDARDVLNLYKSAEAERYYNELAGLRVMSMSLTANKSCSPSCLLYSFGLFGSREQ